MKKIITLMLSLTLLITTCAFPVGAFAEDEPETEQHEHSLSFVEGVEPDCENEGRAPYYYCAECEKMFNNEAAETQVTEEELIIPAKGHSLVLKNAVAQTCSQNGSRAYYECSACKKLFKYSNPEKETTAVDELIPMNDHKLAFKPAVFATFNRDGITEGAYCSVCKTVIVPQKTIKKYGVPKLKKAKKGKKRLTAVWKTVASVDGYVLQVSLKKNFNKKKTYTVKNQSTSEKTATGLKSKKKYYVRVRAYKKINGKKKYSKWSNVKAVKVK